MNPILNLTSDALVKALGWTLLHSLWQGALVALTLALLLVLLQRHTAATRYHMATGAMLLQLLLSVATFGYYYSATQANVPAGQTEAKALYIAGEAGALSAPEATINWAEPLTVAKLYFEQHLPLLVTLWLLGLVVMALRFLGGLAHIQRLRFKSNMLGERWQETMQTIAAQIGVQNAVQLAESALVKVPMVIGFVKPVILLPVGAVAGLSTAQVEAILAHELAHIRRNDYVVNLLQSVLDILYFYHPAMWWMSAVVRDERENCCDDMAVSVCGNSLVYARALAAIAEMQLPQTPKLAMAMAGRKASLLGRIRRLVEQPALRPTFSEGFMAALVIVLGVLFLSAGAMASINEKAASVLNPEPAEKEVVAEKEAVTILPEADAAEESFSAYTFVAQDTVGRRRDIVIIKNQKGEVTELYVNGKQIPEKDIPQYNDLINQRLDAVKNAPRAKKVEVEREIRKEREAVAEAGRGRGGKHEEHRYKYRYTTEDDGLASPPPPPAPPRAPLPPRAPMPVPPVPPAPPVTPLDLDGKNKEEAKKQQKAHEKAMKEYEKEMKRFQEDMKKHEQEIEARAGAQARAGAARHKDAMQRHNETMVRHELSMKRHEESMRRHEELAGILDEVSEELVKDGLMKKDADKIDFKIDNTGMYIGGKKQPQEVYNKYRNLMKSKDGKPLNYTYKKDGSSKSIQVKD